MVDDSAQVIEAVPYDEAFLPLSWEWLRDPEIKQLTLTADFTPVEQRVWFDALADRTDYRAWGIKCDGIRIGAFGFKSWEGDSALWWAYIGDRSYWGRGVGRWIWAHIEERAIDLGIRWLRSRVWKGNEGSIHLHLTRGYRIVDEDDEAVVFELDLVRSE